ncbi:MAG: AraC family transcriptional regulator [Clostridia bacterium]|nr:AraC family transcriptional regulator [Clostridia bacterium]
MAHWYDPKKISSKKRLWNAIVLMLNGANVSEAYINSGFSNFSSFTRLFKKNFKLTPMQYKKEMFNK